MIGVVMAKTKKKKKQKQKQVETLQQNLMDNMNMLISGCKDRQEYLKHQQERLSNHQRNCRLVFDYLRSRKINEVIVNFDGYGDSGQIEDIRFNSDTKEGAENTQGISNEMVPFSGINESSWNSEKGEWDKTTHEGTLKEVLEDIAYEYLANHHGGWEINSGSYGEFVFNIKERKLNITFNERIEEVNTTEEEEEH